MNLQEIAKKYPNSMLKFDEFLAKKYENFSHDYESGNIWVQLKESGTHLLTNAEYNYWLTEFFDEQGIILTLKMPSFFLKWIYLLKWDIQIGKTFKSDMSLDFHSRQQAFESGIEKCFEILEKQLEEEKK